MRSLVFEQFGEPAEVLTVQDVTTPEPRQGEVRVRMLASPINPSDLMTIRGCYVKLPELPAVPGFEGVGIVEAAGGGLLAKLLVGKRVAVLNQKSGNWCEQAVVPAKQAIPLSSSLSVEQGAMFFVNPATAFIMTRKILEVPHGCWLLQTAAGSTLAQMVIRLGKRFGFRTINVVRRKEQVEELKTFGADEVLVFNPQEADADEFKHAVMAITAGDGIRFAIDPVGGATASAVAECLGIGGRLLLYGTLTGEPISFAPRTLMTPGASIEGFWLGRWMTQQKLLAKLRLVKNITRLIREGILVSEVGQEFPLDDIAEAVRFAETPGRRGKALLRIAER